MWSERFIELTLGILTVGLVLQAGCSSGGSDGASGLYRLGSGPYLVTSIEEMQDGCNLGGIEEGTTFYLTLDNTTGRASLARQSTPACSADLGCGRISDNGGELTIVTESMPAKECSPRISVKSSITLIDDLKFRLTLIHHVEEPGTPEPCPVHPECTSKFTLLLAPP